MDWVDLLMNHSWVLTIILGLTFVFPSKLLKVIGIFLLFVLATIVNNKTLGSMAFPLIWFLGTLPLLKKKNQTSHIVYICITLLTLASINFSLFYSFLLSFTAILLYFGRDKSRSLSLVFPVLGTLISFLLLGIEYGLYFTTSNPEYCYFALIALMLMTNIELNEYYMNYEKRFFDSLFIIFLFISFNLQLVHITSEIFATFSYKVNSQFYLFFTMLMMVSFFMIFGAAKNKISQKVIAFFIFCFPFFTLNTKATVASLEASFIIIISHLMLYKIFVDFLPIIVKKTQAFTQVLLISSGLFFLHKGGILTVENIFFEYLSFDLNLLLVFVVFFTYNDIVISLIKRYGKIPSQN